MRVLQVSPYYWPAREWGGPAKSIALLGSALQKAGIEVRVVTTTTRGDCLLPSLERGRHQIMGVNVAYHGAFGPRRYFFSPGLALDAGRDLSRVDLVHIHGLWTFPTLAVGSLCRSMSIPYVISPRGALQPWALRQKSSKKSAYFSLFERRTLQAAAMVHFTTEQERDESRSVLGSERSFVVPNCIELDAFSGVPPERDAGQLNLLIIGRIHPVKGFDVILPALKRAVGVRRGIVLRIAGADEAGYRKRVEELAEELGIIPNVTFLGDLDRQELAGELARCQIVVVPSYQENFGMAAAEAMASGRAVIVSDRVSISQEIERAGAGVVVSLNPEAFCNAILDLAASPRRRRELAKAGREFVERSFSLAAVGGKMAFEYESILRGEKRLRLSGFG